ncbi:MAG: 3-hydroxyacyl-ACP dehydratase FabZ [Deltaproteobacteria bacterium]|nr:3-hydroxyacyl-ACP dehydratase FabZ [Deltaproteobacteria bacterium]
MISIEKIQTLLPHGYPFLLVDRVVEIELGKRILALKNVTVNEPFFQGHFPGRPIMPGVLILEAMAQAGGILAFETIKQYNVKDRVVYFMGIDKAKFRRIVVPGDQLMLEAEILKHRGGVYWSFQTYARVEGAVVAEAKMLAALEKK